MGKEEKLPVFMGIKIGADHRIVDERRISPGESPGFVFFGFFLNTINS